MTVGDFLVYEDEWTREFGAETEDARQIMGSCLGLIIRRRPQIRSADVVEYLRSGLELVRRANTVRTLVAHEETWNATLGTDTEDARHLLGAAIATLVRRRPEITTETLARYIGGALRLMRQFVGPAEPPEEVQS